MVSATHSCATMATSQPPTLGIHRACLLTDFSQNSTAHSCAAMATSRQPILGIHKASLWTYFSQNSMAHPCATMSTSQQPLLGINKTSLWTYFGQNSMHNQIFLLQYFLNNTLYVQPWPHVNNQFLAFTKPLYGQTSEYWQGHHGNVEPNLCIHKASLWQYFILSEPCVCACV